MPTTFEQTWQYSANKSFLASSALDLTRQLMWLISAQLCGYQTGGAITTGVWTIFGSSAYYGGSQQAGLDTTDRWDLSGTYDGTRIVRASAGSNHSWLCLKSPSIGGANYYLIFDFASATDATTRIVWAKAAPTGGSATARPTSTQEWFCHTSVTTDHGLHDSTFATGYRMNVGMTTTGNWYVTVNKKNTAFFNLFMNFDALANAHASNQFPVNCGFTYSASGLSNNGGSSPFNMSAGTPNNARCVRKWSDATAEGFPHIWTTMGALYSNTAQTFFHDTNRTFGVDAITGGYIDWPIHVFGFETTGTKLYYQGRLRDYASSMYSIPVGAVEPTGGGTPASFHVGSGILVPCNYTPDMGP